MTNEGRQKAIGLLAGGVCENVIADDGFIERKTAKQFREGELVFRGMGTSGREIVQEERRKGGVPAGGRVGGEFDADAREERGEVAPDQDKASLRHWKAGRKGGREVGADSGRTHAGGLG